MQNLIDIQNINWSAILIPLGTFTAAFLILLLARGILFRRLHRWAEGTDTHLDDFVIDSIRTPFLLWSLMISLMAAMWVAPLSERYTALSSKVLLVLLILSMTLAAARIAGAVVRHYGSTSSGAVPGTSLTQNIVSMAVASIGLLILLNSLGITITPILTAMGVGGLAVALALQDTLANLFAGFYVSLSGQVKLGDYIRLDTGQEGTIEDIGWRAVSIRALQNNMIIVPNAKLAQAILTNFHLPNSPMSLLIPVGVSYDSDPERIEQILLEEAREAVGKVEGLLGDPEPMVRFIPGFGESSLDFTLIVRVAQFTDQFPVQHELRKRIFKRFRAEGIEIPFPIRTLYIRKEGGEADKPLSAGG
ncbi:MAG: mechanosensitive ion channel family protein [Bryobacteraceae bacterium]|nr:mechanosensitive ion channel family protein [Bryobacteraceae bacterium]